MKVLSGAVRHSRFQSDLRKAADRLETFVTPGKVCGCHQTRAIFQFAATFGDGIRRRGCRASTRKTGILSAIRSNSDNAASLSTGTWGARAPADQPRPDIPHPSGILAQRRHQVSPAVHDYDRERNDGPVTSRLTRKSRATPCSKTKAEMRFMIRDRRLGRPARYIQVRNGQRPSESPVGGSLQFRQWRLRLPACPADCRPAPANHIAQITRPTVARASEVEIK